MTTFFIVSSLLCAFCTYNLYRPSGRNIVMSVMSFFISALFGELVLYALGIQVITVLVFICCGAIQGLAATLALALTLVSWLGLINYFITAAHSADDLRTKLDQLVGKDIDSSFTLLPTQFSREIWRRVIKPFGIHLDDVNREVDVVYAEVNGLRLKMDIYTPKAIDKKSASAPVLMYFHGGGLHEKGGTKTIQGLPMLNDFASNGWVAVSVDYRLSPTYKWPDHLVDCKTALQWIKNNIANYGGNPDFIITNGDSAGGQLSALMALTANKPEFQPGELEGFDSSIQGAICCYSVMNFGGLYDTQAYGVPREVWFDNIIEANLSAEEREQQLKDSTPIANIHSDAPPMLVIHGVKDTLISVEESRLFAEKLTPVSNSLVIYSDIAGAHHSFNLFRSPRCELVHIECIRFANYLYEQWQQTEH